MSNKRTLLSLILLVSSSAHAEVKGMEDGYQQAFESLKNGQKNSETLKKAIERWVSPRMDVQAKDAKALQIEPVARKTVPDLVIVPEPSQSEEETRDWEDVKEITFGRGGVSEIVVEKTEPSSVRVPEETTPEAVTEIQFQGP